MEGKEPMKKQLLALIVICLLLGTLSAVACGQQTAVEPTPAGSTEDLVQVGSQQFEQNCAACHSLTTEAKAGPGLAGLFDKNQLPNGNPVNEENLKGWIVSGGGAMPGIPLTEEQLTAVVAFLKEETQP
jgi:mono/diheme cytochrome c family protein